MSTSRGKQIGTILSYSAFILSGCFIFSPLHRSENIIVSFISAFLVGFTALFIILFLDKKLFQKVKYPLSFYVIFCIFISILSVLSSLMLITEIIKDVAYVSGRNISYFYYILISIAVLSVSFYLCSNGQKGIFRFCIISATSFLFMIILTLLSFATTKNIVMDMDFKDAGAIISSAKAGAVTGLYLTADSILYIFCFKNLIGKEKLPEKQIITGFFISFILIGVYNITTSLIFGKTLSKSISDPDYALVKLIPGTDFTEIISAIRIISFIIKSSVYIFCSSKVLGKIFSRTKKVTTLLILGHYLFIPIIVIILTLFDKSLGYGAFQHLIYPAVILLSLFFLFAGTKKKL